MNLTETMKRVTEMQDRFPSPIPDDCESPADFESSYPLEASEMCQVLETFVDGMTRVLEGLEKRTKK